MANLLWRLRSHTNRNAKIVFNLDAEFLGAVVIQMRFKRSGAQAQYNKSSRLKEAVTPFVEK